MCLPNKSWSVIANEKDKREQNTNRIMKSIQNQYEHWQYINHHSNHLITERKEKENLTKQTQNNLIISIGIRINAYNPPIQHTK